MHQNIYARGDLPSYRLKRQIQFRHQSHYFQSGQHITATVCMSCSKTAFMPGVQCLKHIHSFSTPYFSYDYSIRPQYKKVNIK